MLQRAMASPESLEEVSFRKMDDDALRVDSALHAGLTSELQQIGDSERPEELPVTCSEQTEHGPVDPDSASQDCEHGENDAPAEPLDFFFEVSYSSNRKARFVNIMKCMSQEIINFVGLCEKEGMPAPPPGMIYEANSLTDRQGVELSDLEIAAIENLARDRFPLRYTFSPTYIRRALCELAEESGFGGSLRRHSSASRLRERRNSFTRRHSDTARLSIPAG
mmetsp:Transcript_91598/g.162229  ORF Transcript_91598/g.162229 Transcript_91598/m.162229 type:complete len:222 (-) Transcript_91598:125-790(-)